MAPKARSLAAIAPLAVLLALLLPALPAGAADAARAATPPAAARAGKTRTLYVTVGSARLRFEAPDGMCFADATHRQQGGVMQLTQRMLRHKGDETLLGVFMPCDSIANPANSFAREGRVPSLGIILWPHKLEAVAPRDNSDAYLDWRAASFPEYAAVNLPLWLLAADPLRQPDDTVSTPDIGSETRRARHSLTAGYTQYLSADGQPFPTTGGIGTLLVNGHPIDIVMRLNAASGVSTREQAHDIMENFMERQARINR